MNATDRPLQLLRDYNDYLVRTAHWKTTVKKRPYPRRQENRANLKAMAQLAVWCDAHEVDARLWLLSLFAVRHWTYPPQFKQLRSEKHLPRFRKEKPGNKYFTNRVQRELTEARVAARTDYDPNRDITGTVENVKRYYLDSGQHQVCMDSVYQTLGFHPRSLVCARCPLAQACGQKLQAMMPFDILALRRGEITAEHAQHVAALHGGNS